MRAADTNILVRLITGDHAGQVRAAEAFIEPGAWVSLVVLAETIWVLESTYAYPHERLITVLQMLLSHREFTLQDSEVVDTALAKYRERPALAFSDCLVLEIARKAGHLPFGTFDRHLGRLPDTEYLKAAG